MRKMRKPIALLFTVLMLISAAPAFAFAEDTAAESSVTWSFDDATGTLTFSGTGAIPTPDWDNIDYDELPTEWYPWGDHLLDVKALVIEEGITEIGYAGMGYLIHCETVSLPSTLKTIGARAFLLDVSVKELIIPEGVTTLETMCFEYMMGLENLVLPEGLTNADEIFGAQCEMYLDSLTIPSTLKSFNSNYVKVFDTVYNKSDDIVIDTTSEFFTSSGTKEYRYFMRAQFLAGYVYELSENKDDESVDEKIDAMMVSVFNSDCGTSLATEDEIEAYIDSLDGFDANVNLTVYCNENSAQHDFCESHFQKHVLFGTDTEHTSCYTMSADAVDSNGNSFSYAIDTENRTLTLDVTGELFFDEDALPAFSYAYRFYDKVVIGEGITKISSYENNLFGRFTDLQLPSTYSDSSYPGDIVQDSGVKNITVASGNTKLVAIDNVLYEILDSDTVSNYKTQYGVDEMGDIALVYYPENRTELNLSDRTSIIEYYSALMLTVIFCCLDSFVHILHLFINLCYFMRAGEHFFVYPRREL